RSRSAEFFKPVPNGGVKPLDLRRTRIWIGWIEPLPGLQRAETDGFRRLSDRAVNGDVLNAVGPRDDDDSARGNGAECSVHPVLEAINELKSGEEVREEAKPIALGAV